MYVCVCVLLLRFSFADDATRRRLKSHEILLKWSKYGVNVLIKRFVLSYVEEMNGQQHSSDSSDVHCAPYVVRNIT